MDEALLDRLHSGLGAGGCVDVAKDGLNALVDGEDADADFVRDLLVGEPFDHEPEYDKITLRQTGTREPVQPNVIVEGLNCCPGSTLVDHNLTR